MRSSLQETDVAAGGRMFAHTVSDVRSAGLYEGIPSGGRSGASCWQGAAHHAWRNRRHGDELAWPPISATRSIANFAPLAPTLWFTPRKTSLDVEIGGVNLKPPTGRRVFLNEADLPKSKESSGKTNNYGLRADAPAQRLRLKGKRDVRRSSAAGDLFMPSSFPLAQTSSGTGVAQVRIRGGEFLAPGPRIRPGMVVFASEKD